ncbi:hypothetical protein ACGFX4_04725 [Kitasatospora sp. NPDC048365]|uniref:hypothetical protein n=1 Tax=Kitasatospora sp. NPDC048365 TaxID=3364050 RepID=UPI003718CDFB
MTLSSAVALAASAPAVAEDTEPAVVVNGTFSSPTVPSNAAAGIDGWTGWGLVSATRADHRLGYQAAMTGVTSPRPLSTRVRGVRAGATVTLSWDDSPDSCLVKGAAKRPYTVSVAGSANTPADFTTNEPLGGNKGNWFYGRTYSFTATEDAPQVTFTAQTVDSNNCGFAVITNVAAKQTSKPSSPGQSDPCAGDSASSPQCKDVAGGKDKIDKCPPTDRECLAGVAGDGKAEKDGIDKETQAVADFGKVPREQDPNTAANDLCALPNALTSTVAPGDAVVPPSDWWFC